MSATLTGLQGMDYYLVRRAMRRLLRLHDPADRRALLARISAEDGPEIRALVEQALREQLAEVLERQQREGAA